MRYFLLILLILVGVVCIVILGYRAGYKTSQQQEEKKWQDCYFELGKPREGHLFDVIYFIDGKTVTSTVDLTKKIEWDGEAFPADNFFSCYGRTIFKIKSLN